MSNQLTTTRQERGQVIAQLNGQIERIDENIYEVLSQSGNGKYEVLKGSLLDVSMPRPHLSWCKV